MNPLLRDAVMHYAAGVTFALMDYMTFRLANNDKEKRISEKEELLSSIALILDANDFKPEEKKTSEDKPEAEAASNQDLESRISKDSVQYAMSIEAVKDYLHKSGLVKLDVPVMKKLSHGIDNLMKQERLNNMTSSGKLWFATFAEFGYDTLLLGSKYYVEVINASPIGSVATNIYQIPVFYAGLLTGNGVKKAIDLGFTSSEERKYDKTVKGLIRETPLIDLVVGYEPSEKVKTVMEDKGVTHYSTKLTTAGMSVYEKMRKYMSGAISTAKEATDGVMNYQHNREEKAKQERQDILDKFNKHTQR